jgi:dihydrofolate reductase
LKEFRCFPTIGQGLGRQSFDFQQAGKDILVMGSGELVRSLMRHNLVDIYKLLIHPLVLGSGRRLFPDDGSLAALKLVDSVTTTTGVMIATYLAAELSAISYQPSAQS